VGGISLSNGNATGNQVVLESGSTVFLDVIGGGAVAGNAGGEAEGAGNTVTITKGNVGRNVFGGAADMLGNANTPSHAIGNKVTISNGATIGGQVSGGGTTKGDVTANKVSIDASSVSGTVYGGGTATGAASDNHVTITNGGTFGGSIFGGDTSSGDATINTVNINAGSVSGSVYGGGTATGNATGNHVTMTGGSAYSILGGATFTGKASGNTVSVDGTIISNNIYGGRVATLGDVSGNEVTIRGNSGIADDVYGGETISGKASGNTVTIGGSSAAKKVFGGHAKNAGNATGNIVNIEDNARISDVTYGGYSQGADSNDQFTGNTLNKKSEASQLQGTTGNFATVNFTYSGNANITSLNTTVRNGGTSTPLIELNTNNGDITFGGTITGTGGIEKLGEGALTLSGTNAYTGGTTVSKGTLSIGGDSNIGNGTNTLAGGTLLLTGATYTKAWTLDTGSNAIDDHGGSVAFSGALTGHGGFTKQGGGTLTLSGTNTYGGMTTVEKGILELSASASLASTNLTLHGNATFRTSGFTQSLDGGSLTVRGEKAIYDGDLHATGATLNFIYPSPAALSDTLLTVTGKADISDSEINAGVHLPGGTRLPLGTQLSLLKARDGLTADNLRLGSGIAEAGVTEILGLALTPDPATGELMGTVISGVVDKRAKVLSEGFVAGVGLVNQGADLIAGKGMESAVGAAAQAGMATAGRGFAAFGALSGGSQRYNTGSHVDMASLSLLAGLSFGADLPAGRLTLGAFFEYGNGSYDTHNSFGAGAVNGDGDIYHTGGGILGRMDFANTGPGRVYAEASGRAGGVHNEYDNSDLRDVHGRKAGYDSSSAYYGAHLGLGYLWNVTEAASLDLYGKYFWTRQEGDTVRLTTDDRVKFDDTDSHRLRLGGRFAFAANEHISPYIGAAWEHEFDGKARAYTANGFAIDAPSLRGDTGIGELGLSVRPSAAVPLSFDLGVQGYTGKREGVTGSLQVRLEF
jgi:autotransporter-associated beta strand protein